MITWCVVGAVTGQQLQLIPYQVESTTGLGAEVHEVVNIAG
jgi:hypothetical protein